MNNTNILTEFKQAFIRYAQLTLKQLILESIKFMKISAFIIAVSTISGLFLYIALKNQFIYLTQNGIMRNLNYYYLTIENIQFLMELGLLILITNWIYRIIKKFPANWEKINNQP
jgi:hypothetical protein